MSTKRSQIRQPSGVQVRLAVCAVAAAFTLTGLSLSACTGSSQTPTPQNVKAVDENAPAPEQLAVQLENLATALSGAQNDCDVVAAQLYGWTKGRQGDFPATAAKTADTQLEQSVYDGYKQRMDAALSGILDAVQRCKNHAGAQAAFTEFDVMLDPPE